MTKFRDTWRRALFDQRKADIKAELDRIGNAKGSDARLQTILDRLQELDAESSAEAYRDRFILCISALYHHQRSGGLSKKQIAEISELAAAILTVAGVKPGTSQMSYLHAELHFAISDLHLQNREFLSALWEQQLGTQLANLPEEMKARRQLGMAVHSLRLGHASLALRFISLALDNSQEAMFRNKIQIHHLRALRLMGRHEETIRMAELYKNKCNEELYKLEFEWEASCARASLTCDLTPMLKMVKKGGSHHSTSYLLECFLWLRVHPKTEMLRRLPKLATLAQYKGIQFRHYQDLYAIALQLEAAYDTSIQFSQRLSGLKKILELVPQLQQIDKEMLAWLAIARWLYRSRYSDIAGIIFYEYTSQSRKLSEPGNSDVLGMAADLTAVDWAEKVLPIDSDH